MTLLEAERGQSLAFAPERAQQGLHAYVQAITAAAGACSESTLCELAEYASAYIAFDKRLAHRPAQDLALIWDEQHGWAIAAETSSSDDLLVVAWYGPEVLPTPKEVARFTRSVLAGTHDHSIATSETEPGHAGTVRNRLQQYCPARAGG